MLVNGNINMKEYTGAMLHGCLKTDPNKLAEVSSLDLGMIPEEVVNDQISPLIKQLGDVLEQYKVYLWISMGYVEDKSTENEL